MAKNEPRVGRKKKFADGKAVVHVEYSIAEDQVVQEVLPMLLVEGSKGPRPITMAEWFREASRQMAKRVKAGKFRPCPEDERVDEAPIHNVLSKAEAARREWFLNET